MKRTILFFCIFFIYQSLLSQNVGQKVNTKYFRPSITKLFYEPANNNERIIISKFNTLGVISKFNDHSIDFPTLKVETNDPQKTLKMAQYLQKASNPILAKWWNRSPEGNFDYNFVAQRGSYTATDADAMISRSSNTDRIEMLGEQLIDKSYSLVYEITELYSMETYYDRIDANNRKKSNYTPVKRSDEGFVMKYNVYAYKINYNDSVTATFYNKYWVDIKNHDPNKVTLWESATFPMIFKAKVNGEIQSTQAKDSKKKKTMKELLEEIPEKWQEQSMFELNKIIDDFRLKVSVFKTYPVTAKLGTKEGLYIDQRFYVYEIEVDRKGNQKTNRMGVVRAKSITDNKKIATGETEPSTFQQVDGRRLYEGMFMESKEDYGLILNIGSNSSSNKSLGGFNLGLDYRISRLISSPGIHIGLDLSINSMKDVKPGEITTPSFILTNTLTELSGYSTALGVNLSKEMYFTDRGNVYLRPTVGFGFMSYNFNKFNGTDISANDEKDYTWSALYMPLGAGLGWNITPSVSLEMKPGITINFKATTGNDEQLSQSSTNYSDNWGFNSIGKMGLSLYNTVNLRVRF